MKSKFILFRWMRYLTTQRFWERVYIGASSRIVATSAKTASKKRTKSLGGGYNGSGGEYREKVLSYWKKYGKKPAKFWYDLYCNGKDSYDPRYIPDDMWYKEILPYFNYYLMRQAYRDKAMYSRLLPDVKKPETVVKNIAGFYYDGDGDHLISREEAERICASEDHLIVKPSVISGSGRDITFFDRDREDSEQIPQIFDRFEKNFVVQRLMKQHADLAKINRDSVNTIRVVTFHFNDQVYVLSTILRMGGAGARLDNISAGGISCVIKPDGWLAEKSVTRKNQWTDQHPSGIKFKDIRVPGFEKVLETAKRLHCQLPYFDLIGWDFSVNEEEEPVFVEFNILPEPNQISCGPTFGDLTEQVLDEVFIKQTMKNRFR